MTDERDEPREEDAGAEVAPTESVPPQAPTEVTPVQEPPPEVPPPAAASGETPDPAASTPGEAEAAGIPPGAADTGAGTEKPRRNLVPLLVGGGVLLVALAIGAFFLFGRGGRPETPQETLQAFFTELHQGECTKAAELADPNLLPEAELCRDVRASRQELGTFRRIQSTRLRGNQAEVVFQYTHQGVTDFRIAQFRKTEEGWLLSGGDACYAVESPQVPTEDANQIDALEAVFPPTYGPHAAGFSERGTIYDEPQPTEELVHAMYHGGLVFWVRPDLSPQLKEKATTAINALFKEGYNALIVTPSSELRVPFAMTAWGHRQQCVGIREENIRTFTEQYYASGEREGYIACLFGPEATKELPRCKERLSE